MNGILPGQIASASMAENPETESENCTICLESFSPSQPVTTTICNHRYHETCLNKWLNIGNTCPLCKTILSDRTIAPNNLDDNHILPIHQEARLDVLTWLWLLGSLAPEIPLHDFNDDLAPSSLQGNNAATVNWLWLLGIRYTSDDV